MKSFQQALEKRVAGKTKTDKHTIFHTVKQIILELFGTAGENNVTVVDWLNGVLVLSCEKSVWRTEVVLNRGKITNLINNRCRGQVVSDIKIRQFPW